MMHVSPFDWVRRDAQPAMFAIVTVALIATMVVMRNVGAPLINDDAPSGIITFELARTAEDSHQILASWSPAARESAMLGLGLDFLYLCVYPLWFALAALLLGRRLGGGWSRSGTWMSWGVLLTAPLDAMENVGLIVQVGHGASATWALVAWICAVPKFALLAIAATYLLLGAVSLGARWAFGRR
jgi:hypothetical protein